MSLSMTDENSDPLPNNLNCNVDWSVRLQHEVEGSCKLEVDVDDSLLVNDTVLAKQEKKLKKKQSALERRHKTMFGKSGMKSGSLLKYLIKDENRSATPSMFPNSDDTGRATNSNVNFNYNGADIHLDNSGGGDDDSMFERSPSPADSDVVFVEECPNKRRERENNIEEIILLSESECGSQEDRVSGQSSEPHSQSQCQPSIPFTRGQPYANLSNVLNPEFDEPESSNRMDENDKVESCLQRHTDLHEHLHLPQESDFLPSPSKIARTESTLTATIILAPTDQTPVKLPALSESPKFALKISKVYSLVNKENSSPTIAIPCSSRSCSSTVSTPKNIDKAKKNILHLTFQEMDNTHVDELISKKHCNWKEILPILQQEFEKGYIPKKACVGLLIRRAVLCDGARVSKEVQNESIKFVESLMNKYPAVSDTGGDMSVHYYLGIFKTISEAKNNSENTLFPFLSNLYEKVVADLDAKVETKALRLLVVLTNLLISQYDKYIQPKLKLRPPLFQDFLEEKVETVFGFTKNCLWIMEQLFKTNTNTPELLCVCVKWTDLIAKRLGDFANTQKGYWQMVKCFANKCLDRDDLGLPVVMNLAYKQFSLHVCQAIIFQKLQFVKIENENIRVTETDALNYLAKLAKTLAIQPSVKIVSEVTEVTCVMDPSLKFIKTNVECYLDNLKNRERRGKNAKGETRLHILCRPNYYNNQESPILEIRDHVTKNPDDVNVQDNFGNSALHDCARNNKSDILLELYSLQNGRKLSEPFDFLQYNMSLETPIHLAASYCSLNTVKILLNFVKSNRVLKEVLLTPNGNGLLPFEVAITDEVKEQLKPTEYVEEMFAQEGITLNPPSIAALNASFALKKVVAWWSLGA